MRSSEMITNLRAKKVLCHCVEVVKNFTCCNPRLCFLQRDWREQNSSPKSNRLNEVQVSAEGHHGPVYPRERAGSEHETGFMLGASGSL